MILSRDRNVKKRIVDNVEENTWQKMLIASFFSFTFI